MPWYLMELHPTRPSFPGDATPEELAMVAVHFARLARCANDGQVVLVGRTQETADPLGICVFEADDQEAAADFVAADAAVRAGIFTGVARPYQVVFGSPDALARALADAT